MAATTSHRIEQPVARTASTTRPATRAGSPGRRVGAIAFLAGAVAMAVGGVLYGAAGADLWGVVNSGESIDSYLTDAAAATGTLHTGQVIWIAGVIALAAGGVAIVGSRTDPLAHVTRAIYLLGAALAVPSFVLMAALVRLADRAPVDAGLTETLAFAAARLDDIATALIVGLAALLLSLHRGPEELPRGLRHFGLVAGAVGALSLVVLAMGSLADLGFVIVPVGLIWSLLAGIHVVRST